MAYFYSPTQKGFYHSEANAGRIPADAKEISDELHAQLLNGQSAGQVIVADKNGYPELVPFVPTAEDKQMTLLREALALLASSDVRVLRAYEAGEPVPEDWVVYREELRDVVRGQRDSLPDAPAD